MDNELIELASYWAEEAQETIEVLEINNQAITPEYANAAASLAIYYLLRSRDQEK